MPKNVKASKPPHPRDIVIKKTFSLIKRYEINTFRHSQVYL